MDWQEILTAVLVSILPAVLEHMRHLKTRKKYDVVVEGVEIATQQLEHTKNDKASADLVKMHIRSVATKHKVEEKLNIDVKKIQAILKIIADIETKDDD